MAKFDSVFSFKNLSKEERDAREASAKEAIKRIQEVKEAARACLKLPEFASYVERYQKAEAILVKELLETDDADPVRKAMAVTELQAKLKMLRSLMVDVTRDAK